MKYRLNTQNNKFCRKLTVLEITLGYLVHMFESQSAHFFDYFNRNESIPDSNRLICGNLLTVTCKEQHFT
jgi:hypothetical protein